MSSTFAPSSFSSTDPAPSEFPSSLHAFARRIGILGAGAMGTLFGARLSHAGFPITLVDVNDDLLATLRRQGARCTIDEGPLRAPVEALRAEQLQVGPPLWMVFTKSAHTATALASIAHLITPATHFLSLQNGLGHAEALAQFVPPSRIALGVTTWPARLVGPGEVLSLGQGAIRFMPCDGEFSEVSEVFRQLAVDLNQAHLNCQLDSQVQEAIWEKLAFNVALNGVCGLTRRTVDGLASPIGQQLLDTLLLEVTAVARAQGVQADIERIRAAVHDAVTHHQGHLPSMLQDVLAGRPTEVEAIHGAVVRNALRLGVQVPVTRTLHQLITLMEQAPARRSG